MRWKNRWPAANLNTGRIAIAMSPTSSDYYSKTAWTDRLPLMVQTRIVEFVREHPQDRGGGRANSIGLRPNYVLQTDLRNFEALYYYGGAPIVRVRIVAKLVRMPDRQIIGVASFERCVRARADKVPSVVEAFDQALGSVMKRLVFWTLTTAAARNRPANSTPYNIDVTATRAKPLSDSWGLSRWQRYLERAARGLSGVFLVVVRRGA